MSYKPYRESKVESNNLYMTGLHFRSPQNTVCVFVTASYWVALADLELNSDDPVSAFLVLGLTA